ncbi:MAG: hypothetical protein L0Z62_15395 [Gemmataceae bacterium]|nr:hypothetical protein [Gemmataceae bacterium]
MIECRSCGEIFYADPQRVGARCRRCREPLYERREAGVQEPVPAEAHCTAHPRNPAVGACQGCGTYICGVCRTRWQDQVLCPGCVTRAAGSREVQPQDARLQKRQALVGLIFGTAAWLMTLASAMLVLFMRPGAQGDGPTITAGLLGLSSFLPSLYGVGQSAAVVRTRGERLRLGTFGLVLCGSHLGAVLGVLVISLWQR